MSKNNENKLVPKLRFSEFEDSGEWVEKKLGEVAPLQRGFDLPVANIIIGEYPVVFSNGILKYHSEFKVKAPGVVTGRSGTIGKVTFVEKDFWPHNTSLWVTDFKDNDPLFIFYYFTFIGLEKFASMAGIPTLNRNDVHAHKVFISTSINEQQKIASCLSSLDALITAEAQKLALLKDHKKGLLQSLFPQEGETVPMLRFKEFEDDGEWEETTLTQVADYENGKAHEQDIADDGEFIVVNSKFISQDGEVKKFTNTAFCPATKGDVLMVLSDIPNGRAIAKCFLVEEDNRYTVNQRICRITPRNLNSKILYYLLNRNAYFLAFDDGVKQTNLRKEDVLNCPLLIPSDQKEQKKIADTLSSIDEIINAQSQKLKALQVHKKGLLQGLFPNINEATA